VLNRTSGRGVIRADDVADAHREDGGDRRGKSSPELAAAARAPAGRRPRTRRRRSLPLPAARWEPARR
jgi:hypothetical protein